MYGLIHRAIEAHVRTHAGEDVLQAARRAAGLADVTFVNLAIYEDSATLAFVVACAGACQLEVGPFLEVVGESFIPFVEQTEFGGLLAMAGTHLPDVLTNLDHLHARMAMTFERSRPPSFRVVSLGPSYAEVEYRSTRAGLAPMVVGLFRGLAHRANVHVDLKPLRRREDGHDHDAWALAWTPLPGAPS